MDFTRTRSLVPDLRLPPSTGSTNADLVVLAADPGVPGFTAIATFDQTAGRGRLDRTWDAPAGSAIAVSVLVRDVVEGPGASWIPLIAGLAMCEALDVLLPGRVALKWPNDVLVDERKLCGILVEAAGRDAIIGAGLNLRQTEEELPVPTAMSLRVAGVSPIDDEMVDGVLARYLERLRREFERPQDLLRVRSLVAARCVTLGRSVRVELPDGRILAGTATGIDPGGRLELRDDQGRRSVLAVGDVVHVRAA